MDFKIGLKVNIFGTEFVEAIDEPLGPREIGSTSYAVRLAMRDLYTAYQGGSGEHRSQVPVVEVLSFRVIDMKNGSAYAPEIQIVDWVERRPEFGYAPGEPAQEPARTNGTVLDDELPQTMRPSV